MVAGNDYTRSAASPGIPDSAGLLKTSLNSPPVNPPLFLSSSSPPSSSSPITPGNHFLSPLFLLLNIDSNPWLFAAVSPLSTNRRLFNHRSPTHYPTAFSYRQTSHESLRRRRSKASVCALHSSPRHMFPDCRLSRSALSSPS